MSIKIYKCTCCCGIFFEDKKSIAISDAKKIIDARIRTYSFLCEFCKGAIRNKMILEKYASVKRKYIANQIKLRGYLRHPLAYLVYGIIGALTYYFLHLCN